MTDTRTAPDAVHAHPLRDDDIRDYDEDYGENAQEILALRRLHERTVRADGWTPERQRLFLASIADGFTVEGACQLTGLSVASAYALRRRAGGAGFALGWDAARLVARGPLADALTARAIDGQRETITRPDGSVVERFRYDNRLAANLLTRLDRFAESNAADPAGHATRLVAAEFEAYLATLGEGGARAGLFLARRLAGSGAEALAPVVAIANNDRFVRSGGVEGDVDTRDLDVADRAGWTAEQWARAEAAGLLRLAAAPAHEPQLPQLRRAKSLDLDEDRWGEEGDEPVWYEDSPEEGTGWRTSFPPPPDYLGYEHGNPGDDDYWRDLDDDEQAVIDAEERAKREVIFAQGAAARAAWLAAHAPAPASKRRRAGSRKTAVAPAKAGIAPSDMHRPPLRDDPGGAQPLSSPAH